MKKTSRKTGEPGSIRVRRPVKAKKKGINSVTVSTCSRSRIGLRKFAGITAPVTKAPMM